MYPLLAVNQAPLNRGCRQGAHSGYFRTPQALRPSFQPIM
jgi:hypothetical protein